MSGKKRDVGSGLTTTFGRVVSRQGGALIFSVCYAPGYLCMNSLVLFAFIKSKLPWSAKTELHGTALGIPYCIF